MKKTFKNNLFSIFFLCSNFCGVILGGDFMSFRVDSSKNGYGGFIETTSPLAYSYDANGNGENSGWVMAYRQFGSLDETAGFIGVAQSDPYGEEWLSLIHI